MATLHDLMNWSPVYLCQLLVFLGPKYIGFGEGEGQATFSVFLDWPCLHTTWSPTTKPKPPLPSDVRSTTCSVLRRLCSQWSRLILLLFSTQWEGSHFVWPFYDGSDSMLLNVPLRIVERKPLRITNRGDAPAPLLNDQMIMIKFSTLGIAGPLWTLRVIRVPGRPPVTAPHFDYPCMPVQIRPITGILHLILITTIKIRCRDWDYTRNDTLTWPVWVGGLPSP